MPGMSCWHHEEGIINKCVLLCVLHMYLSLTVVTLEKNAASLQGPQISSGLSSGYFKVRNK